ncbi:MAG TPA: AraC family transcriptional regulator [Acetobacteraceae bacterium]|jgi:AraC-like DNA-binding protein|nr:AraC family transcriptional regulator [Acetobacteraceae bacterium]
MPSSAVRSYTDPDDYATAIRGSKTALTVVNRGNFSGKITRIDFHRLWMQRLSENLPRIMHSSSDSGRAIVSFHTQPGPDLIRAGVAVDCNSIARLGKEHSYFQRSSGLTCWGSLSLPVKEMQSVGAAIAGSDLTPPDNEVIITPPPAAMAKLQRLHAEAGRLAESAPELIANADVARGLEQALIHALVTCLSKVNPGPDSSAHHRHEKIMRRFHAAIAEHPDEAIYIPDLCTTVGVPERTLRQCCYESLGMGPKRYLLLRRMNLARQALRKADAAVTTVTDIAVHFGFWNFGRFATEFKALFGEVPSMTLRGPAS